ncbi:MAG: serine/threonine-protein kinase [Pseudomonadota bacterium]
METIKCPFCGQEHPIESETCPETGKPISLSFLQIGKIVGGKYELLKLLGEGGMGAVYEARNVEIRNHVAMKLLHGAMASNAELRQRFIREAIAAAEIGHENIINVFDKGVDQATGAIYLVMELLKGETLAEKIKKEGPLPVAQTVDIMLQVLSALKGAHGKGIVHRDIKPENIFLTKIAGRNNFVKILDFGIAKMKEPVDGQALTSTGTVMGTAHYMAPEQIASSHNIDGRVDVYSCGVILYEALTGRVPFDAPSVHGVIYKIMNENAPDPRNINSSLSEDVAKILTRAIRRDPRERYATPEEFAAAIEPLGSGEIVFDRPSVTPAAMDGAPPVVAQKPPTAAARAKAAPPKMKKKGISGVVILLAILIPVISIASLGGLVVLNMVVFKDTGPAEPIDDNDIPDWLKKKDAGTSGEADVKTKPPDTTDKPPDSGQVPVETAAPPDPAAEKFKIEFKTDPEGAVIAVDGKRIGNAPLVHQAQAGEVVIEATAEGYKPYKETYEVKSDAALTIALKKKKKNKCDPRDPKCRGGSGR